VASAAAAKKAMFADIDISAESDIVTKLSTLTGKAYKTLSELRAADDEAKRQPAGEKMAEFFLDRVIPVMNELRLAVDEMETLTAISYWPMPNYGDLLFSI
jgi:glutamine synthetase